MTSDGLESGPAALEAEPADGFCRRGRTSRATVRRGQTNTADRVVDEKPDALRRAEARQVELQGAGRDFRRRGIVVVGPIEFFLDGLIVVLSAIGRPPSGTSIPARSGCPWAAGPTGRPGRATGAAGRRSAKRARRPSRSRGERPRPSDGQALKTRSWEEGGKVSATGGPKQGRRQTREEKKNGGLFHANQECIEMPGGYQSKRRDIAIPPLRGFYDRIELQRGVK